MRTGGYNVKNGLLLSLFVVLALIITTQTLFATIDSTSQAGGWTTDATWASGTAPTNGIDTVIVLHDLTLNTSMIVDSLLIVRSTGQLTFSSTDGSFTLDVDGDITNDGTINLDAGDLAVHTVEVARSFDNSGGTLVTQNDGPDFIYFDFNGTNAMTVSGAGTYFRFIHSGTGSLSTGSGAITVTNRLDLQSTAGDFTLGSGGLVVEANTVNINGNSFDALTNSSPITFQSSGAKTMTVNGTNIDTLDLYDCTVSGNDVTLLASNANVNLRINNNLTLTDQNILFSGSGQTESISYGSNGAIVYNGSSAQTTGEEWTSAVSPINVTVNNANDVTIAGTGVAGDRLLSGNVSLTNGELRHAATGRILTVNGNVNGGSGAYGQTDDCTLLLNGSLNQNVTVTNSLALHNLTINKTFGSTVLVTVQSGASISLDNNSTLRVQVGTLRFSTTAQLNAPGASNTLRIDANGVLETAGTSLGGFETFTTSTGTVVFSGSATETLPTAVTIGTVEIDNSANVQTGLGTLTISDGLVLTNGDITTTTTNILKLDASATIGGTPGASSMVVGPLQKEYTTTSNDSFVYPLGTGTDYRPAAFEYANFTSGGTSVLEIQYSTSSFTPKTLPSGIDEIDTDSHYILREQGTTPTSSFTYTFSGTFEDGNFNPESRNNILVETSTSYTVGTDSLVNEANNVATGDFGNALPSALGFRAVFGASAATTITWDNGGTGQSWFTPANWDPNGVPSSTDNVIISGAQTINIDAGSAQCSTLTVGDGANRVTLTISTTSDSLKIYSNSSTALTVNNNSVLALSSDGVVDFSPTVAAAYDAAYSNYTTASIVEYQGGSVNVDTYGDLILNGATASTGTGTITTSGDLKKQGISIFTSSNNITVNGDSVLISAGTFGLGSTTLSFNGLNFQISGSAQVSGGTGTVTMTGTNSQTITDNSSNTLTFNDFTINKSSNNVTLNDSVIVNGTLTLTSGLLNTTNANIIRLGSSGSVSGASSSSYVDGPFANTGTGNKFFPLGDQGDYRPLDLLTINGTNPIIRFEMVSNDPGGTAGSPLTNISTVRYWAGSVIAGSFSFAQGGVRLYWGSDDGVDGLLSNLRVATASTVNGTYSNAGNSATTGNGSSGTITSFGIFATIQNYTLGDASNDNSLPVTLTSFTANADFSKITLNWQTESEIDNQGFNIYRATGTNPENWVAINNELIPGVGNTSAKTQYSLVDQSVVSGETYYYQLESVSYNGVRELFVESTVTVTAPIPTEFALLNNYPNPFNPVTNLKFQLPEQSEVSMNIFDIQGHLVKKLLSKSVYSVGEHTVKWNATDDNNKNVATGVYFYQFISGNVQKFGKMMLIK